MLVCLANYDDADCPHPSQVKCQDVRATYECRGCIEQSLLCNGHRDCSNGWDEEPDTCGQLAYLFIDFTARQHRYGCPVCHTLELAFRLVLKLMTVSGYYALRTCGVRKFE